MQTSTDPSTISSGPQFTTAQVILWTGLKAERLRYWKKILPPIANRDGRTSRYSFEEIIALSAIERATSQLHVTVSRFKESAESVFEGAAHYVTDNKGPPVLYISENEMEFGYTKQMPEVAALAIVRIDLIYNEMRNKMLEPSQPAPQFDLFSS